MFREEYFFLRYENEKKSIELPFWQNSENFIDFLE